MSNLCSSVKTRNLFGVIFAAVTLVACSDDGRGNTPADDDVNVTSTQIGDAFQSIQTGMVFQYLASVPSGSLNTALTLGLQLDFNGLVA